MFLGCCPATAHGLNELRPDKCRRSNRVRGASAGGRIGQSAANRDGREREPDADCAPDDRRCSRHGTETRDIRKPGCRVGTRVGHSPRARDRHEQRDERNGDGDDTGPCFGPALEIIRQQERADQRKRHEGQKLGGLISSAVGIGLMTFLRGVERQEPVYLVGFIPLLVGVALLAYVFLTPARD